MNKHIVSEKAYYLVFSFLIALTLLTVGLSFIDLDGIMVRLFPPANGLGGGLHLVVGLTIAVSKTLLVALFFMHLLYSSRLSWIMFVGGVFWLGILLVLTLADYLSRNVLAY